MLAQTDVSLKFNFTDKEDNEYIFYLPDSFDVSGELC